jgi:hypothetical protein
MTGTLEVEDDDIVGAFAKPWTGHVERLLGDLSTIFGRADAD